MNSRLSVATSLTALLLAFPAFAQAPQQLVAGKSQIRFAFQQMGVSVEGRFRKFEASVLFDPRKPEETRAAFEVDLGSIDLGSVEGETEARRKPWLHVEAFPRATFVAASVTAAGPGSFVASGPLTIKGATQPVTAPFTVTDSDGVRTVEGQFPLRRLQFRIGEGAWSDTDTVADQVTVRFRFVIPITP
ncbi:MAG: YceI family protein [Betaproteobacteria bacterium]|nr:YceI family protein [Betaproteobacteria bacterium]